MIESNGFGFNGENPDANLEFLTEPSDAHLTWFPGNASERLLPAFRREEDDADRAVKICLDGQREEYEDEETFSVARIETEPRIRLSFMIGEF